MTGNVDWKREKLFGEFWCHPFCWRDATEDGGDGGDSDVGGGRDYQDIRFVYKMIQPRATVQDKLYMREYWTSR